MAELAEVIKKEGNEIVLYDSKGEKVLGRFPFGKDEKYEDEKAARAAAHKREGQIQFFKKQKENEELDDYTAAWLIEFAEAGKPPPGWNQPPGWDMASAKKFFSSLGGSVTKCMAKMKGHMDDPAAFCAALKDFVTGTTKWRGKESEVVEAEGESLSQRVASVRDAFRIATQPPPKTTSPTAEDVYTYVQEVFDGYLIAKRGGQLWKVTYTRDKDGKYQFAPVDKWEAVRVETQYVTTGEAARAIVAEAEPVSLMEADDERMELDIALIKPGFGNKRDNHYYPARVLKRDAHVFQGLKMFETDHRDKERSTRTWVSTITEAGKRFLPDGTPVARVAVHDKAFWEKLKTLRTQGLLSKMENSILALGEAKRGKVNGKTANVVEQITKGKYVDWVTRAGAGGHVLALYEAEIAADLDLLTFDLLAEHRPDLVERVRQEEKAKLYGRITELQEAKVDEEKKIEELQRKLTALEADKTQLTEQIAELQRERQKAQVEAALAEADLPDAAKKRVVTLLESETPNENELETAIKEAIENEKRYIAEIRESGRVRDMGSEEVAQATEKEIAEAQSKVVDKFLGGIGGKK